MGLFTFSSMLTLSIVFFADVLALPPPAVTCRSGNSNCTISGTYGTWPDRSTCKAAQVFYPASEQQIVDAVAFGVRNNMKMKVVTRLSHSIPKLVCPGGDQGLVISTKNYSSGIVIDREAMTVTVDSGVELRNFVDTLASSQLAFPQSSYWSGVTIGGLLSTGAHGSSLRDLGSAVHEYVTSIRLVVPASPAEGYAKVLTFTQASEDLDAVKVSLGVLGVLSKITLKVEPMFKRSVTNTMRSDSDLEDQVATFANGNDYGDITWYPSMNQAVYRIDQRVPSIVPGNGVNDFIGFQPTAVLISQATRTTERVFEFTRDTQGTCNRARLQAFTLWTTGYGLKNNGVLFTGYPLIGNQNRIQTSGTCYNSSSSLFTCPWDPSIDGLFFHQTTISIALERSRDFILDVKRLRNATSNGLCGPDGYSGFLMRYVKKSSAYLGKPEDSVDIDVTYYRADDANTPRLNEDVLEELEQMAVFKYQGTPHWGKNRNVAFVNASRKYPNLPKFLDAKKRLDPNALFSSEWSDLVLGVTTAGLTSDKDHCALEGLCICSSDRHCAPERGYFCRPGRVFQQARVCRFEERLV
ncbi:L-gulonolactone oxidase 3 [Selaginella moellendorffii]|nr:L-gulonolactone oxidase 3 [Selaginella moellendorffii]|eukprot:XP_002971003.2 L-gulonolactone oxidase 3 [Selaginella moellendorffii]